MSAITINGNRLVPTHIPALAIQAPSNTLLSSDDGEAAESDYILLQTKDKPLDADQKDLLVEKNVEIQEYVSKNTYLCRYKDAHLNPIRSLDFISYAAVYQPELVVEKGLKSSESPSNEVQIILHTGVSSKDELEKVSAQIAQTAHVSAEQVKFESGSARLRLSKDLMDSIARIDEVKYINPIPQPRLLNNIARKILNFDPSQNDTPYKGEGQFVCVADTGFDTGDKTNCHHAFKNRVHKLYARGRQASGKTDDLDGHGTHVCGSVLGDGNSPVNGGRIESPASKAKLLMQSVFDKFYPNQDAPDPYDPRYMNAGLNGLGPSYEDLFDQAYRDGARIHTNSYGSGPGAYEDAAEEIDKYLWKRKDMVVLFAAGNEGVDIKAAFGRVDLGSIGREASAKNCIAVGASENLRPDLEFGGGPPLRYGRWVKDFAFAPLSTDHVANNAEGLAAFSSRGPTMEVAESQRYKPDVVAPGTCILSARSSKIIQGRFSEFWGISHDGDWCYEGGTSMACPLVAGCCAVIRGCLSDNGLPEPSAALIKALLINGATELKGQYTPSEIGPAPNNDAGFGRVDIRGSLASIVPASSDRGSYGDGPELNDRNPTSHSFPITVPNSGVTTLKVTVVWTDPAGSKLQNVLDLIVTDPTGTMEKHGNMTGKIFSAPNMRGDDTFDRRNNVQQVVWQGVQPGKCVVTIQVYQITAHNGKQPFAYAWRLY